MTSLEEKKARLLAAYTDELLADREPALPAEAASLFTAEELVQALSTARLLKGLLRPSHLDSRVESSMRARLVERMRTTRGAAIAGSTSVVTLPALIGEWRRNASLSVAALAGQVGISEGELGRLETDSVPFNTIAPERLIAIAKALAIPLQQLLQGAQASAERWLPRLANRGLQRGLVGFQATTGLNAAAEREAARREAAETLDNYLAELEHLARELGLS